MVSAAFIHNGCRILLQRAPSLSSMDFSAPCSQWLSFTLVSVLRPSRKDSKFQVERPVTIFFYLLKQIRNFFMNVEHEFFSFKGVLLSGNEISQILSVILIYYGGSGHRPRWIAIGVAFSALSCLVLALPHFIYGPGQEALALTHEYVNSSILSTEVIEKKHLPICSNFPRTDSCDQKDLSNTSIFPKLLVFFSQFILGIGTTLYYGLGQTYMDDNTKKKNAPMLLGKYEVGDCLHNNIARL